MKALKLSLVILAAASVTIGLSGMAYAFHDGGVAYCDGCHTMHNSSGNVTILKGGKQFQGVAYLLKGSDQSSTCLNCHSGTTLSSYHVMTYPVPTASAPVNRTPGGDFAWLGKSYAAVGHGSASPGERHGHNVIAVDFGLVADSTLTTAPGGSYSANGTNNFGCQSCHDPHSSARIIDANGTIAYSAVGQKTLPILGSGSYGAAPTATEAVGVYRLLGGVNYLPMSYPGGPAFVNAPPVAVAPSAYNRTESATETRVAYGKGMSEWCSNCHTNIHDNNTGTANTAFIHPAGNGALLTASANISGQSTSIAAIYNAYKMSGDLTNTQATSYTSMVPYEEGTTTIATLAGHAVTNGSQTSGPITGTENVMCLSCHRAHATGFNSLSRWNNNAEMLTVAGLWPDVANSASSSYSNGMPLLDYQAAMYDRPATNYATYQRSLCNKCHAKD